MLVVSALRFAAERAETHFYVGFQAVQVFSHFAVFLFGPVRQFVFQHHKQFAFGKRKNLIIPTGIKSAFAYFSTFRNLLFQSRLDLSTDLINAVAHPLSLKISRHNPLAFRQRE